MLRWVLRTCTAAYVIGLALAGLPDVGLLSGLAVYALAELRPSVRFRHRRAADSVPA